VRIVRIGESWLLLFYPPHHTASTTHGFVKTKECYALCPGGRLLSPCNTWYTWVCLHAPVYLGSLIGNTHYENGYTRHSYLEVLYDSLHLAFVPTVVQKFWIKYVQTELKDNKVIVQPLLKPA